MKILMVNDMASCAATMAKYMPYLNVIVTQTRARLPTFTVHHRTKKFNGLTIREKTEELENLKKSYDIFLAIGWEAAICCFLANLKFGIYFLGTDIRSPPFHIYRSPIEKYKFIFRRLSYYALRSASFVVAGGPELYYYLKQFRKDASYIPVMVDLDFFNPYIPKMQLPYEKFTFIIPQRIIPQKGYEILWAAIRNTKEDFIALQIDWPERSTDQYIDYYHKIVSDIPRKVALKPIIPRSKLPVFFVSIDAVIGPMMHGSLSSAAREAAACRSPVIAYSKFSYNSKPCPFIPRENDPKAISELLDRIVKDDCFRNQLAENEYKYTVKTFNPLKISKRWDEEFERILFTEKRDFFIGKTINIVRKIKRNVKHFLKTWYI